MRKIYSILSIMIVLMAFVGCYKDKGNYDYKDLPKPLITGIEKRYDTYVGDKLIIKPVIKYADGKPEVKNAEYSWIINTKEVSKERDLDFVVNLSPGERMYASYTVKDLDNNISTIVKFEVYAQSEFKQGWLILSEVEGKGYLCYQRPDGEFYEDVYKMFNEESLSANPVRLVEHWLPWSGAMGQINVICKGAPNYSVELDGASFTKVIYNKQEFVGDKEPANFAPTNAWYVSGFDMLLSNGKLFTRQITSGYDAKYQEGLFVDVPSYGDYELSDWASGRHQVWDNEILTYDKKNRRYVVINSAVISSINTSKDINKAFAVVNMTKEVIAGDVNIAMSNKNYFVTILKDFNDGKYYMHRFYMSGWSSPRTFYSTSETLIEDGGIIKSDTKFAVSRFRPYVFMATGSKLYRYNIDTNQVPELIADYGKKIHSLALNLKSDVIAMIIGDSDGKGNDFITADVSLVGGGKIITEKKGVCGRGVDVIFKVGDQWEIPYE